MLGGCFLFAGPMTPARAMEVVDVVANDMFHGRCKLAEPVSEIPCVMVLARGEMVEGEVVFWERVFDALSELGLALVLLVHHRLKFLVVSLGNWSPT